MPTPEDADASQLPRPTPRARPPRRAPSPSGGRRTLLLAVGAAGTLLTFPAAAWLEEAHDRREAVAHHRSSTNPTGAPGNTRPPIPAGDTPRNGRANAHDASATLWSLGLVATALGLALVVAGRRPPRSTRARPEATVSTTAPTRDAASGTPPPSAGPSAANIAAAKWKADALARQLREMAVCARAHARAEPSGDPRLDALADQFQQLARRTESASRRLTAITASPADDAAAVHGERSARRGPLDGPVVP